MLNLVLFGPPGSGKGTQAQNLMKKYDLLHVSTGDLFRNEIANKTDLGLKAQTFIDRGKLVPDEVVIGMIRSHLDKQMGNSTAGVIFDGFPRTVAQAQELDKLLKEKGMDISYVIALKVSEEELIKRIKVRGQNSQRSDDSNGDIVKKRIEEYKEKTLPVEGYYDQQDKFIAINGEGTIEQIFDLITEQINNLN